MFLIIYRICLNYLKNKSEKRQDYLYIFVYTVQNLFLFNKKVRFYNILKKNYLPIEQNKNFFEKWTIS